MMNLKLNGRNETLDVDACEASEEGVKNDDAVTTKYSPRSMEY